MTDHAPSPLTQTEGTGEFPPFPHRKGACICDTGGHLRHSNNSDDMLAGLDAVLLSTVTRWFRTPVT